jgi:DNA polymerase (family 10)
MALPEQARDILAAQDVVPFRPRQHIGKKLQAKIREMARTGALDQYARMVADLPPHIGGLMEAPGIGPRLAREIYERLGIGTVEDLVRAARDGRLRTVRGFGAKRTRAIAALDLPDARVRTATMRSLFDLPGSA